MTAPDTPMDPADRKWPGSFPPRKRPSGRFSRREERAVTILCAIYALRIVGLYMVLPVLSPYAASLEGATGLLTGLAIGAYGLTQGIFQIPFGWLSDRIGRKRTLVVGLCLFAAGSAIAALAQSIHVLVVGRLVQGMGAIASVVVALAADLTRAQVRTQAMARIGVWVGGAFAVGMTAGPFVAGAVGVPALFWATAVLSVLGAVQLAIGVPEPRRRGGRHRSVVRGEEPEDESGPETEERVRRDDLRYLLGQRALVLLDVGTFLLHLTLTAIFVVLPFVFERELGPGQIGKLVVPVVLLGLGTMVATATYSDRTGKIQRVFFLGGCLFLVACGILALDGREALGAGAGLSVFVLAIACLEPILPALTTRFATGPHRGAAMGVFHMSQFLGSFFGGLVGGAFLTRGLALPFSVLAGFVALWLLASRSLGHWYPEGRGNFG